MAALTAESLFREHFVALYRDASEAALADLRKSDANPAGNPRLLEPLTAAAETFCRVAPDALDEPALQLDYSDASVRALSAALSKFGKKASNLHAAGAGDASTLANLVIHGTAYLGECIVRTYGGRWSLRNPLWESVVVLDSAAGTASLPIFHWWLRALASATDEATEGAAFGDLASRYRSYVEVPCFDPTSLAIIAEPSRRLPRITKVRYDVLYKHLKAHLPELRDLGAHFPTPERFAAYEFKWLDFQWLGSGKMLLFFGLTSTGLHLFWLSKMGFEKAAFIPCDAFPEPILKSDDTKIVVVYSLEKKTVSQEMLWWGM